MKLSLIMGLALVPVSYSITVYRNGHEIDDPSDYIADTIDLPRIKSTVKQYLPPEKLSLDIPVSHDRTISGSILNLKPKHLQKQKSKIRYALPSFKFGSTRKKPKIDYPAKQHEEDEMQHDSLPQVKVSSPRSWFRNYLVYKSKESKVPHTLHGGKNTFTSNIVTYEDLQSDPNNLKQWTQLVALGQDREDLYGKPKETPNVVNINNFIDYLTEHHGFNPQDLDFLRKGELDYGIEEIEKELNKLKDREKNADKTIVIGGEDRLNGAASYPAIMAYLYLGYSLMLIFFL